jgi:hypothetical protein
MLLERIKVAIGLLLLMCNIESSAQHLKILSPHSTRALSDYLYIVYSKLECANCSFVMSDVISDSLLSLRIPSENRYMVVAKTRKIEVDAYVEQFKFLVPQPAIISSDSLFRDLQHRLATDKFLGGIVIVDSSGNTLCKFTFKDPAYKQKLAEYLLLD